MFASRRGAVDDEVRDRFIRVVGLPPMVDDPPGPEATAPEYADDRPPEPGLIEPGLAAPAGSSVRAAIRALDPGRRGVRALAAVAIVVVAVAGFVAWRSRPQVEPVAVVRTEAPAGSAAASPGTATTVVVAVTGKVVHPGLVRLPAGARVADAIEAAGGVQPNTDLSFVNVARKVADGELITVGVTAPPGVAGDGGGAPGTNGQAPGGPLNLNLATEAQFESLPGIGPVLAQHIVDYRSAHGQFRSVDELKQVTGLGASRYAQIKPLVTV